MNILITGAAGYIGSVTHNNLNKINKIKIYGVDKFKKKKRFCNKEIPNLFKYDYSNQKKISNLLKIKKIDTVIHFAANTNVIESVKNPEKFYKDLDKTKKFIDICIDCQVKNFFFSSSAAVYKSNNKKINENSKIAPKSPYGIVKIEIEKYLKLKAKKNFKVNILRFFNVIGADNNLCAGQVIDNSNLIMNLYKSAYCNKKFYLNGTYNNTKIDVSPVRDFFDVNIISKVILNLLKKKSKNYFNIYNLGSGRGVSLLKFILQFELLTQRKIKILNKKKNKKEIFISIANINKLTARVGKVHNNLNNSIKLHIDWLRKVNV